MSTLLDSVVAHWNLDETSGTRVDSFGSNDLADAVTTPIATGKLGNALDFEEGVDDYLFLADNAALSMGDIDFTVACWLQIESTGADKFALGKFLTTGDQREYAILYRNATDRIQWRCSSDGTSGNTTLLDADTLGAPSTGTWYFVVCWYDVTIDKLGIQVNNGTADLSGEHLLGAADKTSEFDIGRRDGSTTDDWDGLIDEVSIWKRLLTANEKTKLYNSGNGLVYPFSTGVPSGMASLGVGV